MIVTSATPLVTRAAWASDNCTPTACPADQLCTAPTPALNPPCPTGSEPDESDAEKSLGREDQKERDRRRADQVQEEERADHRNHLVVHREVLVDVHGSDSEHGNRA